MIVLLCKIEDGVYKYQELPAKIVDNIILPFGWNKRAKPYKSKK